PSTEEVDSTVISQGQQFMFTSKVTVNGKVYFRTKSDTDSNTRLAIPASDVEEIPYTTFNGGHYCMQLSVDSAKVQPRTGDVVSDKYTNKGRPICLANQTTVNGVTYYQTAQDAKEGID